MPFTLTPLPKTADKLYDFGVVAEGIDLDDISGAFLYSVVRSIIFINR